MNKPSLLVIGCGDLGSAVAGHFAAADWQVWGSAPAAATAARRDDVGCRCHRARVATGIGGVAARDLVLIVLSPGAFTDERYRDVYVQGLTNCLRVLNRSRLRRVVWVSSTSVFQQDGGQWLDENSPAVPSGFSGRRLLEAEALLGVADIPHTIVRCGGIYSPAASGCCGNCAPDCARRHCRRAVAAASTATI